MATWRDFGSQPIKSTRGLVAGSTISTNVPIAEVDSTQLGSTSWVKQRTFLVSWVIGSATTISRWRLEQTLSTGVGSTAIRDQTNVFASSNQSAEFMMTYTLEPGDRLRARLASTVAGDASAKISAEPIV